MNFNFMCSHVDCYHLKLTFHLQLLSSCAFVVVLARPEIPRARFQAPQFSPPPLRQELPRQYGVPASSYGPPPPQPEITKSVFVHLPPNDNEQPLPSQVLPAQPPKKHYKIIFIKAPESAQPAAPIIPPQPQDEHKTLVYVLVKKPDEQPQIELPTPETTQPSKPEVYFIKYNVNKTPQTSYGTPANPPQSSYGSPNPPQIDSQYGAPNPSSESEALAF